MAPTKAAAVSLNQMVHEDRKRRKNATLAQEIFSKNRRASAPGAGNHTRKAGGVLSLADRIGTPGISKRNFSTSRVSAKSITKTRATPPRTGNVNAEWTHDLHSKNNPSAAKASFLPPREPRALRDQRKDRVEYALTNSRSSPALNGLYNVVGKPKPGLAMTIRGLAGPYAIIAKNMAIGTTEADIESAMTPVGGVVIKCRIVADKPKVIAEIVFETKEGADNVVETFNKAYADGNILQVYHKNGPVNHAPKAPVPNSVPISPLGRSVTPLGPRADGYGGTSDRYVSRGRSREREHRRDSYSRDDVVDGTYGFDDKMDTDEQGGLYSDNLITSQSRTVDSRDRGDRSRNYR